MADLTTAIARQQVTQKTVALEMKWPTNSKSLTVQLEDSLFTDGSCQIVIEGDYQDGRGYVFMASGNGIVAGAKGQRGESPGLTLIHEDFFNGRELIKAKIPVTVKISIVPEKGTPVVGLKTDAEIL